jgi:hypothetical protein
MDKAAASNKLLLVKMHATRSKRVLRVLIDTICRLAKSAAAQRFNARSFRLITNSAYERRAFASVRSRTIDLIC